LHPTGFAAGNPPDGDDGSPYVSIYAPTGNSKSTFLYDFDHYVTALNIGYHKPIVHLDFKDF
jgi:hypothetical protein